MYRYMIILGLLTTAGCGGNGNDGGSSSDTPMQQQEVNVDEGDSNDDAPVEQQLVYIDDGAVQCDKPYVPAETTAQQLIDAGIDVASSHCGTIGHDIPQECGSGTNTMHVHMISPSNLDDAEQLGFQAITEDQYKERECESFKIEPQPEENFSEDSYTFHYRDRDLMPSGDWEIEVVEGAVVRVESLSGNTVPEDANDTAPTIDELRLSVYGCGISPSCEITELEYDADYYYPTVFTGEWTEHSVHFEVFNFVPQ